ncbi:hypothetical protein P8452_27842 [Trifolium repens]|nr:hypothetical protein P8452_27842 [Trifolium repens]
MLGYTLNSQSIVDLEDNHQPLINLGAFWLLAVECDSRSNKIPFLSFLSLLFFALVLLFPFLAFYSPGKYQSRFSREKHSTLNTGFLHTSKGNIFGCC